MSEASVCSPTFSGGRTRTISTSDHGDKKTDATSESICVGVRLRPFVGYEQDQKQCLQIYQNTVTVVEDALVDKYDRSKITVKEFAFDHAMDSTNPANKHHVDQGKCYDLMCKRMVGHILEGYNTCLFCYGQTGTGKTTTIMGDPKAKDEKELGVLLRLLNDVFNEAARMQEEGSAALIQVQMLEVYNDKLNDLLHPADKDKKVEVRMNPIHGVYVKNCPPEAVKNLENCVELINFGNTKKTVAATAMNKQSSRGHTIFKLVLDKKGGSEGMNITSEAFFVDLAGRENEKTTRVTGERFVELTFINRSLMFLADCIRELGKSTKKHGSNNMHNMGHFRNSMLTKLLTNALSGNSKTAMIGTLSPAALNFDESYSTLQFASTVKNIKVTARPAAAVDKNVLVNKLQEEVAALKEQLAQGGNADCKADIQQRMEDAQELFEQYKQDWDQKHEEAVAMMQKREEFVTKLGVVRWKLAVQKVNSGQGKGTLFGRGGGPGDTSGGLGGLRGLRGGGTIGLPHLTNFSDDPQQMGVLVMHPAEVDREYSGGTDSGCDFVLPAGLGILKKTLYLKRDAWGQLWIRAANVEPEGGFRRHTVAGPPAGGSVATSMIEVNGSQIGSTYRELKHHDCVVFGRSQVFYVIAKEGEDLPSSLQRVHAKLETEGFDKSREQQMVTKILGEDRSSLRDQVDMAKRYLQILRDFNRDPKGKEVMQDFLLRAQKAKSLVEEANEITQFVWPEKDIFFELIASGPVLSFGFGRSRCPELNVRLVQRIPLEKAKDRLTLGKARRKSSMGALSMLATFAENGVQQNYLDVEEARVDELFVWTWAKFAARLQLMQEVREDKLENPESFKVDPDCDPWSEYGPGEISMLRARSSVTLESAMEETSRLHKENLALRRELEQLRQRAAAQDATAAAPGPVAALPVAALPAAAAGVGDAGAANAESWDAGGPFDGVWAHDLDGERRVELIKGDVIRWQDGLVMRLLMEDAENFFVELQGTIFRAQLVRDELKWEDGDIWIRVSRDVDGSHLAMQDDLRQLLRVHNSSVEQLCKTQQQLIQTVRDGILSLDDKLTKATTGVESSLVPSVAQYVQSIQNGRSCGYLGTTPPSGTYLIRPPGMQQPLAPASTNSGVTVKVAPAPAGLGVLQQRSPEPLGASPVAGPPVQQSAAVAPPTTAVVLPASPARRKASPTYSCQAQLLWRGPVPAVATPPVPGSWNPVCQAGASPRGAPPQLRPSPRLHRQQR